MRQMVREAIEQGGPDPKRALADVRAELASLKKDADRLLANLTAANRDFVDEKLIEIRSRLRDLQPKEEELRSRTTQTSNLDAAVEAAMAQVRRFRQVMAQGSILEQKELLRGFVAGITLTPSKDTGVITWYNLPTSFKFSGGTRAGAEKMQARGYQKAIRLHQGAWPRT